MGPEDIQIYVRGVVYLATFVTIASFSGKSSRWRPGVSVFAIGLAGTSAALGVMSFLLPPFALQIGPSWLQTAYCVCVFALVAGCRGNIAKILPPFRGRARA